MCSLTGFCFTAILTLVTVQGKVLHFRSQENYISKPSTDSFFHRNKDVHQKNDPSDFPAFITVNGRRYSTIDGTLAYNHTVVDKGVDTIGVWSKEQHTFVATLPNGDKLPLLASVTTYNQGDILVFGQEYPLGLPNCSVGDSNAVSTGFPSISIPAVNPDNPLGFHAFGWDFLGDHNKVMGIFGNYTEMAPISSGLDSGPLVLFDQSGLTAEVVTAYEEFMGGGVQYDLDEGTVSWGILGTITDLPKNYRYSIIVVLETEGITKMWKKWGRAMRSKYDRPTTARDHALINNYIGYYTDNGAYYYYLTESDMNYEDTMLTVYNYSLQVGIPYKYLQYDSWWYYQGPVRAVYNWTARPDVYPHGARYLWEQHKLPIMAHNRFWSHESVYAKQNGGKYNFIIEKENKLGLPQDYSFWQDLFAEAQQWGLDTYLQDWLNIQTDNMTATTTDVNVVKSWLLDMGRAALERDITLFYCMAPSRHALLTLLIPAVATARASDDHQPGNENWRIGVTSHFAHALGIAPSKDTWWSTTVQPGNPYNLTETYPRLESLAATLSTGPVGPSDKIGYSDVALIMRSCNKNGLILKPSVPAKAIDDQFIQNALHKGPLSDGAEVWSTYSDVSGWRFGIILGVGVNQPYAITPKKASFGKKYPPSELYIHTHSFSDTSAATPDEVQPLGPFSNSHPHTLQNCSKLHPCLLYTSPVFTAASGQQILLTGELDKWVPISPKRVNDIVKSDNDVTVTLTGVYNETITFSAVVDDTPQYAQCTFGATGKAQYSVMLNRCKNL